MPWAIKKDVISKWCDPHPTGFKDAFEQVKEGGWTGIDCDPEFGGQGLPYLVGTAVGEMFASSNMAFGMYQGLTHGIFCHSRPWTEAQNKPICPTWSAVIGQAP